MNLNDAWDKLGEDSFTQHPEPDMETILRREQHSLSLLSTLKKGLMIKLMWVVLFIILLSVLIVVTWESNATIILIPGLLFMILGAISIFPRYQKLPSRTDVGRPSLEVLTMVRDQVTEAIRMETKLGRWFMPLFPIGGMLLALPDDTLSSANISANPGKTILIIIGALVIAYFANILGDKMNNYAFGKDLKRLDEVIHDLEEK